MGSSVITFRFCCIVESKNLFYLIGAGLGVFIGPVQSSSRSLMARLTPENKKAEFFGLYSLSCLLYTSDAADE